MQNDVTNTPNISDFITKTPSAGINQSVKLTIFIPTIRRGWWNIMCNNLNRQNYKNFEVVVVDDYPEDRSKVAEAYAIKYNLDIKYVRGTRGKVKRTYNLARANNQALALATGEVLVFLQDFILMPLDGLEQIATLYRRNPDALQALPDVYTETNGEVDKEKEDWFNGRTDIVGEFIRQNVRIQNLGLRTTNNAKDFEQNYGAIPVKVARELGGWWEFYDEALGYDNVDISYRALMKGYKILIDETNVAICLNIWPVIGNSKENGGSDRSRRLNDPRFVWMVTQMKDGKLPIVRNPEIDDVIDLQYEIPKEIETDKAEDWMNEHLQDIVKGWL